MEVRPKKVQSYVSPNGNEPFWIWLDSLRDRVGAAQILARIRRIEEFGNLGRWGPVGEGVKELKINFGPGYRVYFGEDGDALILLLGGGDKKTQSADIVKAIGRWREYNA